MKYDVEVTINGHRPADIEKALRRMAIINRGLDIGFKVLVVLLLAAIIALLAACGSAPKPAAVAASADTEVLGVGDLAILSSCESSGGAVALDGRHLLTAAHVVVSCTDGPVMVRSGDGSVRLARVELVDVIRDAARLELVPGSTDLDARLEVVAAHVGQPVCIRSGLHEERRCGTIDRIATGRGGVHSSTATIRGDSGSGLYDEAGRLVGIVVNCNTGEDGSCAPSGGGATPMTELSWAVAK